MTLKLTYGVAGEVESAYVFIIHWSQFQSIRLFGGNPKNYIVAEPLYHSA